MVGVFGSKIPSFIPIYDIKHPEFESNFTCECFFVVPVWPHAGGLGLCEMVQHISLFDYISVSPTLENK